MLCMRHLMIFVSLSLLWNRGANPPGLPGPCGHRHPLSLRAWGSVCSFIHINKPTSKGRYCQWGAERSGNLAGGWWNKLSPSPNLGLGLWTKGGRCPQSCGLQGGRWKDPFPAPMGVFSDHTTRLCVALVVAGSPLSPVLQRPLTGSWQKRTLDVPSVSWAAKVSAHLLPSCHDRWWPRPGNAAGNWHGPGLVVGRRRRHQSKGLNTVIYFFSREMLLLLLSTSFAPGKNRNDVYTAKIKRTGKSCDHSLLMLGKSPLSLILHGGALRLARQTAAESSSRGGQWLPGDSRLKPEVLSHAREVLLFLLLAEQTQVTQKTCVRAEGET